MKFLRDVATVVKESPVEAEKIQETEVSLLLANSLAAAVKVRVNLNTLNHSSHIIEGDQIMQKIVFLEQYNASRPAAA